MKINSRDENRCIMHHRESSSCQGKSMEEEARDSMKMLVGTVVYLLVVMAAIIGVMLWWRGQQ